MNALSIQESDNTKSITENLETLAWAKVIENFWEESPRAIKQLLWEIEFTQEMEDNFQKSFGTQIDTLQNLNPEFVWASVLEDVKYTYAYLWNKYEKTKSKLATLWLTPIDITNACTQRIINQVIEASENWRNLKNGRVASLLKYKDNKLFLQEIPYYAFACSNVSLDEVNIWERSLRDIVKLCWNKTDNWEFMLPNSLGISVSVMVEDDGKPVIIWQVRNNKTTLTQRSNERVVASASWAININRDESDIISGAAAEELKEELWLWATEVSKSHFNGTLIEIIDWKDLLSDIGWNTMLRELWISQEATIFRPSALVMEDKRMNPEIVCHAIENDLSLEGIQESWETAESQYESLSIKWIPMSEISDNIKGEKETLDKHFMMSLFWWTGNERFQDLVKN